MKILGISNYTNYYVNGFYGKNKKISVSCPEREMTETYNPVYYMPSFKASKEQEFSNLFTKGLNENLTEEELNILSDYLYEIKMNVKENPLKYFIGSGNFGNVYQINDDYVLKIEKYYYDNMTRKFNYKKDNPFNDIPYYYGGILATCDNLSVMKNADPKKEAIVAGCPLWISSNDRENYILNKSLPAFANLPQSSYDNYALVLKMLNDMCYRIKYDKQRKTPDVNNPNNFIIVDNKIRFVDELATLHNDEQNNLYTICSSFLHQNMNLKNKEQNEDTFKNKREILKKCVLAAEKTELPFSLNNMHELQRIGDILKICGYRTNEKNFMSNLDQIRKMESDKDLRKELITFYMDNLE